MPVPTPDSVEVSDQEIRRFYDQHTADRYRQEEEVRARHILISTRSGLSEQAALTRTDSIRTAIMGGASFEDMARTRSEDPGSAVQGGDLGFFARGRMVKEFSDTSFALKVGVVSQPVKTSFGYHLIRVDERKEAGVRAFDEVRLEIRHELGRAKGDTLARKQAEAIRRRIPKSGAAVAASAVGGVKTSNPIAPNDPLPGVGSVPELGKDLVLLDTRTAEGGAQAAADGRGAGSGRRRERWPQGQRTARPPVRLRAPARRRAARDRQGIRDEGRRHQ